MRSIAVLGNSHVGAIRQGWDEIRDQHQDTDVTFFAAPNRLFDCMELGINKSFGILDPSTVDEENLDKIRALNSSLVIDLTEFDYVFMLRKSVNSRDILNLLASSDVEGIRETESTNLISLSAFNAYIDAEIQSNLPASGWHQWERGKFWIVECPRASEEGLESRKRLKPLLRDTSGIVEALTNASKRNHAALNAVEIGYVPQSQKTIADSGLTHAEFSRDSLRINSASHSDNDFAHMNAEYGRLQWKEILAVLDPQT